MTYYSEGMYNPTSALAAAYARTSQVCGQTVGVCQIDALETQRKTSHGEGAFRKKEKKRMSRFGAAKPHCGPCYSHPIRLTSTSTPSRATCRDSGSP